MRLNVIRNCLFIIGLVALSVGANLLIKHASIFATSVGIKPIIVGLTIVAFGTSALELVVSCLAVIKCSWSNIANIGLILGIAACIRPLKIKNESFSSELPIMLSITAAFIVMIHDGVISRIIGGILVGLLAGYLFINMRDQNETAELLE